MFLNRFSVRILEGIDNGDGYIHLKDETQYSITLRNQHKVGAKAEVFIDGKSVGIWFIKPDSSLTINRPIHVDRALVFSTKRSAEGALDDVSSDDMGVVSVRFIPFKEKSWPNYIHLWNPYCWCTARCSCKRYVYTPWYTTISDKNTTGDIFYNAPITYNTTDTVSISNNTVSSTSNLSASYTVESGGTVLGEETGRNYTANELQAPKNEDYDFDNETLITMRLVCSDMERPKYAKLTPAYSTPVPPPIN